MYFIHQIPEIYAKLIKNLNTFYSDAAKVTKNPLYPLQKQNWIG